MDTEQSMWERMRSGQPYQVDSAIEEKAAAARVRMAAYNQSPEGDEANRQALLADLLGAVGADVVIRPPLHIDFGTHLTIGARTFANYGLVALDVASISIGEDVQIGPNVQLLTPTHPIEPEARRAKWEGGQPISIGDNVWLGGGVIVCPGVSIGANTVVGAGSVVTRDLPADVVAVGNPAKPIGSVNR